jgi:glucose/mannose-6-phosphate isomerase
MPIFAVLQAMGFLVRVDEEVREVVEVLEGLGKLCHRSSSVADNPAKALAKRLDGQLATVYGSAGLMAAAAMRFKCDLNEYAKVPAFWNYLPELDHNEIEGWGGDTEVARRHLVPVFLRDPEEHERVGLRFKITKRLIEPHVADVVELWPEGRSDLARLMSTIFVTQLASIYVGLARGVDPGPVEILDRLKADLAQES